MTLDPTLQQLARALQRMEGFMAKALRGEAVVRLPRALNNAGHGSLRSSQKGEIFSGCFSTLDGNQIATVERFRLNNKSLLLILFS